MKQTGAPVEIVVPEATIFSEHPAVVIDRSVSAADRPVIDAFMQYLWSDEAQADGSYRARLQEVPASESASRR